MSSDGIITNDSGMQNFIGYTLDVGRGDGCARCWLDIDHRFTNRHGVLHGGIISTMLDCAAGATASLTVDDTGLVPFLTISMNTNYLSPAKSGRITATGRVTGGGRSLVFIDAELRGDDDALIATANGVFKKVPGGRPKQNGDQ
ncbi:MAG: PaaI family thioesterase [Hyphomicrobiales bacterium]